MAIEIGTLLISMGADIARLSDDMGKARRTVDGAMSDIRRSAAATRSALELIGVGVSVGAFTGWIKSSIDAADRLNDLSKTTSLTISQLSGLNLAAQQSGSDLGGTADSISKLAENMGKNAEKYAKIGITAKDPLEAFKQLADIFNAIEDPQQRAAFAAEALGKSWKSAAPLLAEGSARIGEMVDRGKELAGDIEKTAAQADIFNDRLAELKVQSGAVGMSLANEMLPELINTATAMRYLQQEGHGVLALWRGLAGMGKVPWDLFFPPEDLKKSLSSQSLIKDLRAEITLLEQHIKESDGQGFLHRWMYGSKADMTKALEVSRNQLAALEAHAKQLDKPAGAASSGKSATSPVGIGDFIGGTKKKTPFDPEADFWDAVDAARSKNAKESQAALIKKDAEDAAQAERDLAAAAREAQSIIYDIDPMAKLQAEWEKLLALKEQGLLTDEQVGKAYEKTFKDISQSGDDSFKRLEDAVRGWGSEFTNVMTQMVRTGKADFGALADSIVNDLIRIQVQKRITDPLVKSGTSFLDSFNFGNLFSFDGGGFTGMGARSGGVDGKGGFLSVLHPNETVIDHTKPNTSGAAQPSVTVIQHITIDSRSDASSIMAAMNMAKERAKAEIMDSMRRGGSFATAVGRA